LLMMGLCGKKEGTWNMQSEKYKKQLMRWWSGDIIGDSGSRLPSATPVSLIVSFPSPALNHSSVSLIVSCVHLFPPYILCRSFLCRQSVCCLYICLYSVSVSMINSQSLFELLFPNVFLSLVLSQSLYLLSFLK